MLDISKYKTIFIDSDGVILDSNDIKSNIFYEVGLPYGKELAQKIYEYNKNNLGISRFKKMEIFLRDIVKKEYSRKEVDDLIEQFGQLCKERLLKAPVTPGAVDFMEKISRYASCYLVTGGSEEETREIYKEKNLFYYFDGIFGSPATKEEILKYILEEIKPQKPFVFIGDSLYDYQSSFNFNIEFIFVSDFTDFKEYKDFFKDKINIHIVRNLMEL